MKTSSRPVRPFHAVSIMLVWEVNLVWSSTIMKQNFRVWSGESLLQNSRIETFIFYEQSAIHKESVPEAKAVNGEFYVRVLEGY